MKTALRVVALLIIIGTVAWWVYAGKNKGWTKNKVRVEKKDEITEIVYYEEEDRFIPGVDILAGGIGTGVVLLGLSLFGKKKLS